VSVGEGPVGLRRLGRLKVFRYEVRRWNGGRIPDVDEAVDSPVHVSQNADLARRVLELVPDFPTATWGADEQRTRDMWNSNSLVSWLLASSGHDCRRIAPPTDGRAPGWSAGLVVAERAKASSQALASGDASASRANSNNHLGQLNEPFQPTQRKPGSRHGRHHC
jgi:hypothetical protein